MSNKSADQTGNKNIDKIEKNTWTPFEEEYVEDSSSYWLMAGVAVGAALLSAGRQYLQGKSNPFSFFTSSKVSSTDKDKAMDSSKRLKIN